MHSRPLGIDSTRSVQLHAASPAANKEGRLSRARSGQGARDRGSRENGDTELEGEISSLSTPR